MVRVPDRPNVQVVQLHAGPTTDESVQADANLIIAALIRSDIDLFNLDGTLYAVDGGNLIMVNSTVLRGIVAKHVAVKTLVNHGGADKWAAEYIPVTLDDRLVRCILVGKDPRTSEPLKGGALLSRVPKAVRQPTTVA